MTTTFRDDERRHAIQILVGVWGSPSVIGRHDCDWLTARAHEGEALLDTCARLAGVPVRDLPPFSEASMWEIRRRGCIAELNLLRGLP